MGAGVQSNGLIGFGKTGPSASTAAEEWDGTNWSATSSGSSARAYLAGCGTRSSAIAFGSWNQTPGAATEEYNSTIFSPATGAWASGGNMPTATTRLAGAGTQTAGLAFGGKTPVSGGATGAYKYDGTSWTTTGSLGTGRYSILS